MAKTKAVGIGILLLLSVFLPIGGAVAQEVVVDNMSDDMFNESDILTISQQDVGDFVAMNKMIEKKGANWIAGKTSVSELSVEDKRKLGVAKMTTELPKDVQLALPQTGVTYEESFDWRNIDGENWMTPVKNQGTCGSCWAFSAIGVVEAAVNIHSNDPNRDVDLSEQHLVSDCCSAGSCSRGYHKYAFKYIRRTGVSNESCFPYIASNSACTPCSGWDENPWKIENYKGVSETKNGFKSALQKYGPLSVILIASDDLYYYRSGVYEPTLNINEEVDELHHAVVLVGWNDSDNCWIIKNSWGSGWGEDGYARVKYGDLEKYSYSYAVTGIIHVDEYINQPPIVEVSANPVNGYAPLDVRFIGNVTDDGTNVSYSWTFGDGTSSTLQNPTHEYTIPGTYYATLKVTDDDGVTRFDNVRITVVGWVSPITATASSYFDGNYKPENAIDDITRTFWISKRYEGSPRWIQFDLGNMEHVTRPISKVRAMFPSPITFDVQIPKDATNWNTVVSDFVVTKNETNTFVEIPFARKYPRYIRLYTESAQGYMYCTEFDASIGGDENQSPDAKASANPVNGYAPLDVRFTGTGIDSDDTIVSYSWTFGDGANSTSQNPTHTYTSPGLYEATLTVTDDDGATGINNVTITVDEPIEGWVNPVTATASSYFDGNYKPENAIDDSTETCWVSKKHYLLSCWIQFDLGNVKQVSKVRAMFHSLKTFDVQVSNDATNWNTVVSDFAVTEKNTFVEIPFPQTNARYIRLYAASEREYGQCTEFDAYVR